MRCTPCGQNSPPLLLAVKHQAPSPSPHSSKGLSLSSVHLSTLIPATDVGDLNVNKHQIPWSLRFFSLLTTNGLLHHSNMAITPVICSRQSYPFTSKIINSNILFSDCILLSFERVQVFQPWSFWLSWDHMYVSPLLSPSPLTCL